MSGPFGRYRRVSVIVWSDEKVRELTRPPPNGRDLWFYLLTAKESLPIPGLIPTVLGMAETLKWEPTGFLAALKEITDQGMAVVDFEAPLLWLPNAVKYNPPESPNVLFKWAKTWGDVPQCSLKLRAHQGLGAHMDELGPAYGKAFREAFPIGWGEPSRKGYPNPTPQGSPHRSGEGWGESGAVSSEQDQEEDFATQKGRSAHLKPVEPPASASGADRAVESKAPKARKQSAQEECVAWFVAERAKHTDESDRPLAAKEANVKVAPVLRELGEPGFKRAALGFLESKKGAKLEPPYALRFFITEYRQFKNGPAPKLVNAGGQQFTELKPGEDLYRREGGK